jgi:hypothetical protein
MIKFVFINNIGLIQIMHISKKNCKNIPYDLRILGFFEIGCPLCSKADRFCMKKYVDSIEKMGWKIDEGR